jgi:hypothetical protein
MKKQNNSFALGRMKRGVMNKTETEYAALLEAHRRDGGWVEQYWFEGIKLCLPGGVFYTPDFLVLCVSGFLECHEVKGFWTDDARVKIKVAAATFPFKFIAVKKLPKKNGGGWGIEDF